MKKSQVVRRTHRTNPLPPSSPHQFNTFQQYTERFRCKAVGSDNLMLPDFFSRRVVHLFDGFAGYVITVLVTCEIEYFHRFVFAGPVVILDHQSLYAGSDCNEKKRAKYNISKCFFLNI